MPMPPGIAKFFSSLPAPPFFSAKEDTLKYHLLKAAEAAAELLPPGGEVPLQMWLDCRMPGEVILCNDNDGLIVLLPKTSQRVKLKAEVGTTPHKASPPTSAGSLWMSPAPPPKAPPGAPPPSPEANLAYKKKGDDGAGWRRQPPAGVAPAAPLRVNCWDDVGLPYTFQEFVAYYGSAATQMWDLAVRPEVRQTVRLF